MNIMPKVVRDLVEQHQSEMRAALTELRANPGATVTVAGFEIAACDRGARKGGA